MVRSPARQHRDRRNPRAGFGAIVRFAGLDLDPARLDRAIEHTSFRRLQAQEVESGYAEKQLTALRFFRAGVAGTWRTALTAAHGDVMAHFGYSGSAAS